MNRSTYFNLCEHWLSLLCTRVELRGKLNILDFHVHSEAFYVNFFNLLFGYALKNLNQTAQNAEGIDLIDAAGKLVMQVSSTATKVKVESALSKDLKEYKGHKFNFVSISKDAAHLRKLTFVNPHGLVFNPNIDIHDVSTILSHILNLSIDKQRVVYDFLKKELKSEDDALSTETNLAAVINILATEKFEDDKLPSALLAFDVDQKVVFNNLDAAATVIEDYKVHHHRIMSVYSEFDSMGQNRSSSVLNWLRHSYLKLSKLHSGDDLFFQVVEDAIKTTKSSTNYVQIPLDELLMWINALTVDAFIRCKIFKNPSEMQNAAA